MGITFDMYEKMLDAKNLCVDIPAAQKLDTGSFSKLFRMCHAIVNDTLLLHAIVPGTYPKSNVAICGALVLYHDVCLCFRSMGEALL
eukprot:7302502-Karenia_brevis.AAC.1